MVSPLYPFSQMYQQYAIDETVFPVSSNSPVLEHPNLEDETYIYLGGYF